MNKSQARRARARRVPKPFASPEALKAAQSSASILEIEVGNLLHYGSPTSKKNLWKKADVVAAAAKARQHLMKIEEAVAPVAEEIGAPEAIEAPEIIVQPIESVDEWAARKAAEAEEVTPAPEPVEAEPAGPGLGERIREFFAGIRMPKVRMPTWAPIAGVALIALILFAIFAVSAVHPRGLVRQAMTSWMIGTFAPKPEPTAEPAGPTPVVEVEPTVVVSVPMTPTTPVSAAVVVTPTAAITTTAPPTPEPLAFASAELPDGQVGVEYQTKVEVGGGEGAVSFDESDVPVPGLGINADTGEISGTPQEAGEFETYIVARDESGYAISQKPKLTVNPAAEEAKIGSITGHIANAAEGTEVRLVKDGDAVSVTVTDAEGNYKFENVPVGEYNIEVTGMVTSSTVSATEDEEAQASALYQVEKGESLWKIFGARTWKTFTDFADAHGLKHHVDDRGTEDTADDLLIVYIQPGQVFDLTAMPSG